MPPLPEPNAGDKRRRSESDEEELEDDEDEEPDAPTSVAVAEKPMGAVAEDVCCVATELAEAAL